MNIAEIFDEVNIRMRSDFEKARKALGHPGLKGASLEETFRTFLKDYLPRALDISSGKLVDANGNISRQLDVIISDSMKTPIFFRSGDLRVIPVECAYAVIEITAYLDASKLSLVFQNMESVRNLKKTAYRESYVSYPVELYGDVFKIWPINYYVFAYNSIDLMTLAEHINKKHQIKRLPLNSRIDTVCVLDKGVICNQAKDGKLDALPDSDSRLCVRETNQALLLLYALTSVYFSQVILPRFCFTDYLDQMEF